MKSRHAAHASTFSKQISANQKRRFFLLVAWARPAEIVKPAMKRESPWNKVKRITQKSKSRCVFSVFLSKIEFTTRFTKETFQVY